MTHIKKLSVAIFFLALVFLTPRFAMADAVSEWNTRACELVGPANVDTPTANRMLAIMHTAIYEAVNAITKKYPASDLKLDATGGASIDAAVASASRATLVKLVPAKALDVEIQYQKVMAAIPDGKSKTAGISIGERAAA